MRKINKIRKIKRNPDSDIEEVLSYKAISEIGGESPVFFILTRGNNKDIGSRLEGKSYFYNNRFLGYSEKIPDEEGYFLYSFRPELDLSLVERKIVKAVASLAEVMYGSKYIGVVQLEDGFLSEKKLKNYLEKYI